MTQRGAVCFHPCMPIPKTSDMLPHHNTTAAAACCSSGFVCAASGILKHPNHATPTLFHRVCPEWCPELLSCPELLWVGVGGVFVTQGSGLGYFVKVWFDLFLVGFLHISGHFAFKLANEVTWVTKGPAPPVLLLSHTLSVMHVLW